MTAQGPGERAKKASRGIILGSYASSASTSGACPPEHLSATHLRYAPLGWARTRPARGGDTLRAPRSQGWSGDALGVLGLDTRRRMGESSAAGVLKSSGTVRFATAGVRAWPFLLILLVALTLITDIPEDYQRRDNENTTPS